MRLLRIKNENMIEEINLSVSKIESSLDILDLNEDISYLNLDSPFYHQVFDLTTGNLLNTNEIIKKWDLKYKENLLNGDLDQINFIMSLDKYFRNENSLNFILKNYLYIPFLLLAYSPKQEIKEFKFYDLLDIPEIDFDIKKELIEEKGDILIQKIKGQIASTYDFVSLKSKLRTELGITPAQVFNLLTSFQGEVLFQEGELISFLFEVALDAGEIYSKKIILSLS